MRCANPILVMGVVIVGSLFPVHANADTLTAVFDIPALFNTGPEDGAPPGTPPYGTLNLSLNPDGTISGSLEASPGLYLGGEFDFNVVGSIAGFTVTDLPENWFGFASTTESGTITFGGFIGSIFYHPLIPPEPPVLLSSLTFTIARTGGFSSVYDLVQLSSGAIVPVDFELLVGVPPNLGWAGAVVVPEPSPSLLLLLGLFVVLIWRFAKITTLQLILEFAPRRDSRKHLGQDLHCSASDAHLLQQFKARSMSPYRSLNDPKSTSDLIFPSILS